MSRIGNRILQIPAGVELKIEKNRVTVKGPKGELTKEFFDCVEIKVEGTELKTIRKNELKTTKQLHGTTNALLDGMLVGVSQGFVKELEIVGVGYRAALAGNKLNLSLGYSHPVEHLIPAGITVEVPKPTHVIISGHDKQLVGEIAAQIRAYRKPEPYKGKGIKYKGEHIIRKVGKAAGK